MSSTPRRWWPLNDCLLIFILLTGYELLELYNYKCAISDYAIEEALEAAHIDAYCKNLNNIQPKTSHTYKSKFIGNFFYCIFLCSYLNNDEDVLKNYLQN